MDQLILDIKTMPDEILKALIESKISNSVLGINSKDLGTGTYLTCVKEIMHPDDGEEPVIILSNYDVTGYFLDKNTLRLSTIESVIPFKSAFENPFLREVERDIADIKFQRDNGNLKVTDFIQ